MMNFLPVDASEVRDPRMPSQVRNDLVKSRFPQAGQMTKYIEGAVFRIAYPGGEDEGFDAAWKQAVRVLLGALQADQLPSYIRHQGEYLRVPHYYWDHLYSIHMSLRDEDVGLWGEDNITLHGPLDPALEGAAILIPGAKADEWVSAQGVIADHAVIPVPYKTGASGRPNTSEVGIRIMVDRFKEGEALPSLAQEARAVNAILQSRADCKDVAKITDRALENGLRTRFNELKSADAP